METTIEWSQAVVSIRQHQKQQEQEQKKYITQFLDESHEMADGRDLLFWQEKTGKPLTWLVNNGTGIADNIKFAVNMGATADDIYNMQPEQLEPEREGAQGAVKLIDSGEIAIHIFGYSPEVEIFICDAVDGYGHTYKTVKTEAEAIRLIENTPEEYFIKFFYNQLRK